MANERKANESDPSHITDHKFESRGAWWDLCKHCKLARSAHAEAVPDEVEFVGDALEEMGA